MPDGKFFSSCGTELNDKGTFCSNCGNSVNRYDAQEAEIHVRRDSVVLADITNKIQNIWMILKWVSLGLGGILVLISVVEFDLYLVAVGCFFGILSRIMQAEEHR